MKMTNDAKEELEGTLCHNDKIRKGERVRMVTMREEERVCMEQNPYGHVLLPLFHNYDVLCFPNFP